MREISRCNEWGLRRESVARMYGTMMLVSRKSISWQKGSSNHKSMEVFEHIIDTHQYREYVYLAVIAHLSSVPAHHRWVSFANIIDLANAISIFPLYAYTAPRSVLNYRRSQFS